MPLDQHQARLFADFAEAAVHVHTPQAFQQLITLHVQPLIHHQRMLAVIGQLSFHHLTVNHHVALHYPEWALEQLVQPINLKERPLLQQWLHTRQPVIACPVADRQRMSEREQWENHVMGLGRLALHGVPDLTKRMGSYFSFAQVDPHIASTDLALRLSLMTPLLHVALLSAMHHEQKDQANHWPLTTIEQELLMWLAAGRSNQEIATLRQRSPATIRNQLAALYTKLGVASRAEAVALTLHMTLNVPEPQAR